MKIGPQDLATLSAAERRELLAELLRQEAEEAEESGPAETHPLSFAQERLWFLDRLRPGSAVYNVPVTYPWTAPLDADVLARSFNEIVRRHAVLRTTFAESEGRPVQVVAPRLALPVPVDDLRQLPPEERREEALRRAEEEARLPFDLARGPLARLRVLRLDDADHQLLVTFHHIVSDGWSMSVFWWELTTLYEAFRQGLPSPLPELPQQYGDFARWQRETLRGKNLERQLAFWRRRLAGAPGVLDLPADRPRPPQQSFRGAVAPFSLGAETSDAVRRLSRREGATLFMVLLAGFQALLFRHTRQPSLLLGTPVAGRSRTELEPLIGFFVNTVVLRADLAPRISFRDLLSRVRASTLEAFEHQDLPFERLVEELRPDRDPSRSPLVQVTFTLYVAPRQPGASADEEAPPAPPQAFTGTAKFDLILSLADAGGELTGSFEYPTDLFDAATVARMAGHHRVLLAAAVERPEEAVASLPLLTFPERRELDRRHGAAQAWPEEATLYELFGRRAERAPDAAAVVTDGGTLTFRGLERAAAGLGRRLAERGVGPEVRVGICLEPGLDLAVAVLAVLHAGGAFVPLDPGYPPERLAYMVADSGVETVISRDGLADRLPAALAPRLLSVGALGDDSEPATIPATGARNLAYVIYTSGSTGRPKGVMIPHRGVINLVTATTSLFGIAAGSRVLQFSSFSFDASVRELFESLLGGATLVMPGAEQKRPGEPLAELLRRQRVSVVTLPPSALLATEPIALPALATVIAAGEACGANAVERWAPGRDFWNAYGPTEDSVCTTAGRCRPAADRPPIGDALAHHRLRVVDPGLELLPLSVPGELLIGGAGLARGYLGRPALTAERFVPDPFAAEPGERLYRSGDLVRWRPDGPLDFLGRIDHQVKLRGFRIEPGEIEEALRAHPEVAEAVVVLREEAAGQPRLIAYLRAQDGEPPAHADLHVFLAGRLPAPMVPSAFVVLDVFPLTPAGKVDRRALPAPGEARPELSAPYRAPGGPLEELVAGVWAQVLRLDRVGAADDFFELGGHSLLAVQIASRLRDAVGFEVPLHEVFNHPTVTDLAAWLARARDPDSPAADERPIEPAEGEPVPSFAQERLWFLDRYRPGSAAYNVPEPVALQDADPAALQRALGEIMRRHSVLRSRFVLDGGRLRLELAPAADPPLPVLDLRALPAGAREIELRRLATIDARRPFDLAGGSLLRAHLLLLGGGRQLLLLTLHHAACDAWSMRVLFWELTTLHEVFAAGAESPLPAPPIQYSDFAAWQRRRLTGERLERLLEYWRQRLAAAPVQLGLPTDRPPPPEPSFRGGRLPITLSADLWQALHALSRQCGASLFMTLLAAFQALLHLESGSRWVVVGVPVSGRERPEIEPLIGFFTDTLPLCAEVEGEASFRELLGQVRTLTLDAFAHQELPFDKLVEELRPERHGASNPIFQVLFSFLSAAASGRSAAVAAAEAGDGPEAPVLPEPLLTTGTAKFDIELSLIESERGLAGAFEYSTDLFDRSSVEALAGRFQRLLEAVVATPDLPIGRLRTEVPEDAAGDGPTEPPAVAAVERFSFEL